MNKRLIPLNSTLKRLLKEADRAQDATSGYLESLNEKASQLEQEKRAAQKQLAEVEYRIQQLNTTREEVRETADSSYRETLQFIVESLGIQSPWTGRFHVEEGETVAFELHEQTQQEEPALRVLPSGEEDTE